MPRVYKGSVYRKCYPGRLADPSESGSASPSEAAPGGGLLTRWVSTDIRINKPLPLMKHFGLNRVLGARGGFIILTPLLIRLNGYVKCISLSLSLYIYIYNICMHVHMYMRIHYMSFVICDL